MCRFEVLNFLCCEDVIYVYSRIMKLACRVGTENRDMEWESKRHKVNETL